MWIKKQIPNTITLLNLLSGLVGIILASNQLYKLAFLMILLGSFFDFFDGMVARLLNVKSEMGKELDSLSDLVTFGVSPSIICYFFFVDIINEYSFIYLLLPLAVAIRLAKFNIQNNHTKYFSGVPSPIVGITIASLPYTIRTIDMNISNYYVTIFSIVIVIISSIMMVSDIKYLKIDLKNKWHLLILIIIVILVTLISTKMFVPIFIFYLLTPLLNKVV